MPCKHGSWIGANGVFRPRKTGTQHLATQSLDEHRRHVATPITPNIDNQPILPDLSVEILDKLLNATGAHVGDM